MSSAKCPGCGRQMSQCGECEGYDGRPAIWHGTDQGVTVARRFGWQTTIDGHRIEDFARVTAAWLLGQVTWNRETQQYDIGQVNEAAIDEKVRSWG